VCTVSRELGHGSEELVRRIYGTSVRSAVGGGGVPCGQRLEGLGDRLRDLRAGTRNNTRDWKVPKREAPRVGN